MRPNQQNSFSFREERSSSFRTGSGGVTHAERELSAPGAAIIGVLRKAIQLIEKLIVLAKFQFYKHTAVAPSAIKVPWTKLGVIGVLGFMAFKQDLSFSVGMGEDGQRAQLGALAVAEEVMIRETGRGKESIWAAVAEEKKVKKKVDYFADAPGDTEKDRRIKAYIRRFKDVAKAERDQFGIPASVKMAQAIVESGAGQSRLAKNNNNHFGIKCFSRKCKKGHCSNFTDDSHKDFFLVYDSAWESFRAHSKMIVSGRYKKLLEHGDDYRAWAKGLKKLGYATAKHYEQTLVGMIEKYHLDTLDE
jgi:hypothetical protein